MKYKIVKETKPTLKTFGKYKAKAVHYGEVGTRVRFRKRWPSISAYLRATSSA